MDQIFIAGKIEKTLQQQILVIKKVYEYQKALTYCVLHRSWEGMEQYVLKSVEASQAFLQLDKQCFLFLDQLNPYSDGVSDFYSYIRILPQQTQQELTALYRTLRHYICMSKIENDSLSAYISHARTLINGMVQAAAESTKTAYYTRTGAPTQGNFTSMVIDTVF
ncbi:MAG: hypothetical protein ACTTH7_02880 [Treponema sp.]